MTEKINHSTVRYAQHNLARPFVLIADLRSIKTV